MTLEIPRKAGDASQRPPDDVLDPGHTLRVADDVTLPLDVLETSSAILAMRGAGKTNAVMVLLEEAVTAGVPVVTIDPKGDHWGIRAGADGAPQGGLPIPVFGGLHGDIALDPGAGAFLADIIREKRLSVVLDVSEFTADQRTRFLTAFAERLYRRPERENLLLVLEEAHEYIPQQARGDEVRMAGAFERLVKLGRFKGLAVVMVTQRSASLHKGALSQTDNLFLMRTKAPQDRAAAKAWLTTVDDAAALTDALPRLADGETLLLQPGSDEPVRFTWRLRSTYDAGRTPKIGETPRPAARLTDIDLAEITAAMSTPTTADQDDLAALRATIANLTQRLRTSDSDRARLFEQLEQERRAAAAERATHADELAAATRPAPDLTSIRAALAEATTAVDALDNSSGAAPNPRPHRPARPLSAAPATPENSTAAARQSPDIGSEAEEGPTRFRLGARRMLTALGQMAPLRLTKSQWGTVARLKTSGGTWSTYLSDLRRAGLIDEDAAGFTLTEAGFDVLGGRPRPMDAAELQQHYLLILRAGAAKMLTALIDAYPGGLTREELGASANLATTGGTFSTYQSDLIRNGLAERRGDVLTATAILMDGAAATPFT